MKTILDNFMLNEVPGLINKGYIDNEYGLQFELGCFLRNQGFDVFFEKNISSYNLKSNIKHEIDLVVSDKKSNKYAIEIKYSRKKDGAKEQKWEMLKDVAFIDELKNNNNSKFNNTYAITLANDDFLQTLVKNTNAYNNIFGGANGGINHSNYTYTKITKKGTPVLYNVPDFNTNWISLKSIAGSYYIVEK